METGNGGGHTVLDTPAPTTTSATQPFKQSSLFRSIRKWQLGRGWGWGVEGVSEGRETEHPGGRDTTNRTRSPTNRPIKVSIDLNHFVHLCSLLGLVPAGPVPDSRRAGDPVKRPKDPPSKQHQLHHRAPPPDGSRLNRTNTSTLPQNSTGAPTDGSTRPHGGRT